ncbi:hypothetical protein [Sinorhizobium medicae]|uniref:hypothetical protein n=1 Tax=Sinorhizobium medicae TaxID=110321 RepID=UPI001F1F92EF|nr:hypothetical protein [Sinorhizobium medicae]UWU12410.1 hypothetical protein N2598_30210 [Sinorhizobium medicae]
MAKGGGGTRVEPAEIEVLPERGFTRATAFVVALENYRKPSNADPLPTVDFADADAFANVIQRVYADLSPENVSVQVLKDADASLTALRDELKYTIKNLSEHELFIIYYAGHGFHGAGGKTKQRDSDFREGVGQKVLKRTRFTYACASLYIASELVTSRS